MAAEWKTQARDILLNPSLSLDDLPGVLSASRSLNPLAHNVADSILFDWMDAVRRGERTGSPERHLEALRIILDAGVDLHQGKLAPKTGGGLTKEGEQLRTYYNLIRGQGGESARRLHMGTPFKGISTAFDNNWLGKVIWAARDHPLLPQMVQLFLDRGVHPHDQGNLIFLKGESTKFDASGTSPLQQGLPNNIKTHPWSSWPTALASGRTDVLALLARHAGDSRPPDHSPATWAALNAAMQNPAWMDKALTGISWFLDRYPPTLDERAAVARTFFRDKGGQPFSIDPLVLWLTLPQSTLHHPEGPLETPEGFNPWSCIDQTSMQVEPCMAQMSKILLQHPRWGNAKDLLDAPSSMVGDAARDPRMQECSILASWIKDSWARSGHEEALPPTVDQVFSRLDALGGLEDQSLPRVFVWMKRPPGPEASAWLKRNSEAWLGRETPWHHGPWSAIQDWLHEIGISPWAPDRQGVAGVAKGLVERLKDWNKQRAESFISHTRPLLKDARMEWGQSVEGFSMAQWAHGSTLADGLSPLKGWDAGALSVAVFLGDSRRFEGLMEDWRKAGSPALSLQEGQQLMDAWSRGSSRFSVPPNNTVWQEEDVSLRRDMLNSLRAEGVLSPDVLSQPDLQGKGWLWRRMMGLRGADSGQRHDMIALWKAYGECGATLTQRDRWALALWALDSSSQSFSDTQDAPIGPAATSMWGHLLKEEKARVAQATLMLAQRKMDKLDVLWMDAFLREFSGVEDLSLGANDKRVDRLVKFLEQDAPWLYEKKRKAVPPLLGRWAAASLSRKMEGSIPSLPPVPRPGLRGRF